MAFEQKDNTGAIFVNDRKTEEEHPDRTGTVMVGGKLYYANGWLKKTKDGRPYLSLTFKPKVEDGAKSSNTRDAFLMQHDSSRRGKAASERVRARP